MTAVTFIGRFALPGGPMYIRGDRAMLDDDVAEAAIRQGAALRDQRAYYGESVDAPAANKMMAQPSKKKGL